MNDLYTPEINKQTRIRYRLALAAYIYEIEGGPPLMPDHEFDKMCREVDLSISTRRPDLDEWFQKNFNPSTGQWIYGHPELDRIRDLVEQMRSK